MNIIIATNNEGKIKEMKQLLQSEQVYSLKDIGYNKEIDEYGDTYHINALIKAQTIAEEYKEYTVIADDSGLNVKVLNDNPGVYSARYGQNEEGYKENKDLTNNKLLLKQLEQQDDRNAYFKSVMCVIKPNEEPIFFSGTLSGEIAKEIFPGQGFGYDPIFIHKDKFLSQMELEQKNSISHRAKALNKVVKYLKDEK